MLGAARGEPADGLEGPRYHHARIDLADGDLLRAYFEEAAASLEVFRSAGRVGLVNNAGVLDPVDLVPELSPESLRHALGVNVVAPVWLMGFAVRTWPRRPVRIVNLSSGAATSAYPGWAAYCASKAALRIAGECLALELGESAELRGRDVAVVSYAPNVVATRMQEEIRGTEERRFPRRERFLRLQERGELVAPEGPAEEIAALLERDDLPPWSESRFVPR